MLYYRSFAQPCGLSTRSNFQNPSFRPAIATKMVTRMVMTGSICVPADAVHAGFELSQMRCGETETRDATRADVVKRAGMHGGARTSGGGILLLQPRRHALRRARTNAHAIQLAASGQSQTVGRAQTEAWCGTGGGGRRTCTAPVSLPPCASSAASPGCRALPP